MRMNLRRWAQTVILIVATAVLGTQAGGQQPSPYGMLRNGEIGFVVSNIVGATRADGVTTEAACPKGLSLDPAEIHALSLSPEERAAHRSQIRGAPSWYYADGGSICQNPSKAGGPDPYYRTLDAVVRAEGMDLDGRAGASRLGAANQCADGDLIGADGARNVDNQLLRVVGCSRGYQPGGIGASGYQGGMHDGEWTLIIKLSGVDNLREDVDVDVMIGTSSDPLERLANGQGMRGATYLWDPNPSWRTTTKGRIENGVLTTTPTDIRYHVSVMAGGGRSERDRQETYFRDARLRLSLAPDGAATGLLAGYEDIETLYRMRFALDGNADNASFAAEAVGYTCQGVYFSLRRLADWRDPATGKCTAISSQYKITAVPVFTVP
jgi:hypothetical protein